MKITNIRILCDMCGESISPYAPLPYRVAKIEFLPLNEPSKVIKDVCYKCNKKLFSFLQQEDMLSYAQLGERWEKSL